MRWFWEKDKRIYLDYAAATPVRDEARAAFRDALGTFGNPSSLHSEGVAAGVLLESARESIARIFQCKAGELVFTSGGTEGNNLAIFGSTSRLNPEEVHVVVSTIEHPSVLEPIAELERRGMRVTRVAPDEHGRIAPERVRDALTPETALVSVGWANSEIGVVQQLSAIAKEIRAYEAEQGTKIIFHTDAGQAPLYIKSTVYSLGVDVMTLDSGKLYGPRGIGALFIKRGVKLAPLLFGGMQEGGMRAGTENVALAAGMAAALRAAALERESESARLTELKSEFMHMLQQALPNVMLNGEPKHSLPHIINISIPDIDAEYVALALDHRGVAVSTKTSCKEGERESMVVKAIAPDSWRSRSALRFSFGRETTARDSSRTLEILKEVLMLPR
ncbi:MAG: cysteine desulfurase [Parcubacteria group bacterium]|nr:cysteine desulfurase [Parcubacteria group bacterium]